MRCTLCDEDGHTAANCPKLMVLHGRVDKMQTDVEKEVEGTATSSATTTAEGEAAEPTGEPSWDLPAENVAEPSQPASGSMPTPRVSVEGEASEPKGRGKGESKDKGKSKGQGKSRMHGTTAKGDSLPWMRGNPEYDAYFCKGAKARAEVGGAAETNGAGILKNCGIAIISPGGNGEGDLFHKVSCCALLIFNADFLKESNLHF